MDLNELRTKHPDVYAAAVQLGVDQERDRACAHLKLGKESGAMATAIKAIEEGSGMTMTLTAEYLSAGMKNQEVSNREEDNPDPDVGNGEHVVVPDAKDALEASVADAVVGAFGGTVNG